MTEKRTDYYELQIKINPDMEDIIFVLKIFRAKAWFLLKKLTKI